jgi:hypothetical protein
MTKNYRSHHQLPLTPRRRSKRINGSTSPRTTDISTAVLNQFTGHTFLEEKKQTIKVNEPLLSQRR